MKNILICYRGRLDSDARALFASKLLNEKKNFDAFFLHDRKIDNYTIKLLSFFKLKTINLKNFKYIFNLYLMLYFLYTSVFSVIMLFIYKKKWLVNNFKVKNIYVGDLVYDQYVRFYYNFRSNFISLSLIRLIISTIFKVLSIEHFIKKKKIELYIATSYSYASISSLAVRISTYKKIKTLMIGGNYYRIFEDYEKSLKGFYHISKERLQKFRENNQKVNLASEYFAMRLNGQSFTKDRKANNLHFNELDAKRAFGDKFEINKREFIKKYAIDNKRPIFVIATHGFKDANHLYGKFLFDDFLDEVEFILEKVKENEHFHWFIKKHPMSDFYKESDVVKNILEKKKIKNVQLIDNNISTKSILEIADRIFTSRGTIAIEYAALGKCAYTSSRSYFSDLGFTHLINDRKELVDCLKFKKIKRLNTTDMINAKCALFIRKEELLRENIYNLTEPERHVGKDEFMNQFDKLMNSKNKFLIVNKAYNDILDSI